jgi:chromosome segregation ATPase
MSKVNLESAKNNIERVSSNLSELQQLLLSKKEEISNKVKDFDDLLSNFFKNADEKNQAISQEEERKTNNTSKLDQLNQQLQELTHQKDILLSEISSKQKDIEQLSNVTLEREKSNTELTLQVDSNTERISDFKRKIEELDVLSQATRDETKEEMRRREIKNAELNEQYNRLISRSRALIYLVKNDIVNLPEIQVLRSLNVPGVDSELNLRKTSGVSENLIRNVLVDLDRREIISFDPHTGRIQILTNIDI